MLLVALPGPNPQAFAVLRFNQANQGSGRFLPGRHDDDQLLALLRHQAILERESHFLLRCRKQTFRSLACYAVGRRFLTLLL
jgi:hypothetical protein